MDLRTKLATQIGTLVLTNIELNDMIETMHTQAKEREEKLASVQKAFDEAVDKRDTPSGAPSPVN